VRGLDPPRLDMLLAEGYELLHSTVASLRENRAEIGEAFEGMRKTLKGTGEFFDKNGPRLDRTMANVEQVSADGVELVKGAREKYVENPEIDRIVKNVDRVTEVAARDAPPLLADARETMANARRVSATIGDEKQQAKLRQTLDDVSQIAASGKMATKDAQEITARIRSGKGSVGALVMDEQLYDDLQELARDLKHNPWKFLWRE
jgi:phospholipid/cholesterol/gamma-HCH transport system substrate-binding protein